MVAVVFQLFTKKDFGEMYFNLDTSESGLSAEQHFHFNLTVN